MALKVALSGNLMVQQANLGKRGSSSGSRLNDVMKQLHGMELTTDVLAALYVTQI